jgi:hypothetical protein
LNNDRQITTKADVFPDERRKMHIFPKKTAIYFVVSKKGSTFASQLRKTTAP